MKTFLTIFYRGFVLPNGKFVGKNILKQLIVINKGHDYKIAHKISERYLLVEGTSRMNVKLAVQIFSNSVSKAIAYLGEMVYFYLYSWKDINLNITFNYL